MIKNTIWIFKN